MTKLCFEDAYRQCADRLLRLMKKRWGLSDDSAEETASQVWLFAFRHWERFNPERSQPIAWLAAIARTKLENQWRRQRMVRITNADFSSIEVIDNRESLTEVTDRIAVLRERLPADLHPVLDAWSRNLSDIEIAKATSLPAGSVYFHKSRIREIAQSVR